MMANLWQSLGSKLADRWIAALFSPALLFWTAGLGLRLRDCPWGELEARFTALPAAAQGGLAVVALLLVTLSAAAARQFTFPVLQLLEGYWPRWCNPLRRRLLARQARKTAEQETRFQALAGKGLDDLTREESEEYRRLDAALMGLPADERYLMPTRLGRLLRSAELAPAERYGLDGVVCWPRLWLLLPEATRDALTRGRAELNDAANLWLWGLLFLAWTPWAWWAPLVALAVMRYAYGWTLRAARVYGALIVSAYDLHRLDLYRALRWPLPENPADELEKGKALTAYLWRGSDRDAPTFENA
ncbi:hypothetical protein [Endothiovibrio diazotrophicus]